MQPEQIFDFEEKAVRTVEIDGAPWFVGKDVCACLEIADHHQALGRLDADEVYGGYSIPTIKGERPTKLISEPGVYRLVFTSRSEVAERFKRWLAHEVLPSLRKAGRYEMPKRAGDDPVDILSALDVLELGQTMRTLREVRLTFGMRAARNLARRLPLPEDITRPPDQPGKPDSITRFADDVIVREIGRRIGAGDLYDAYLAWCAKHGLVPETPVAFGRRMTALGLGRAKSCGRTVYTDVGLAEGVMGEGRPGPPSA